MRPYNKANLGTIPKFAAFDEQTRADYVSLTIATPRFLVEASSMLPKGAFTRTATT
jgi:hypothetical protein